MGASGRASAAAAVGATAHRAAVRTAADAAEPCGGGARQRAAAAGAARCDHGRRAAAYQRADHRAVRAAGGLPSAQSLRADGDARGDGTAAEWPAAAVAGPAD